MIATINSPNGKGPEAEYMAIVEAGTVQVQAEPEPEPEQEPTSIIDDLAAFETDDDNALKTFALDAIPQLADLSRAELVKFCEALKARGVSGEWIRRELRPAVNDEKRKTAQGITWVDYVDAGKGLGYTFRLNDLEDTLEVNDQRMTDVIEAELLSKLHAIGLRNVDVARRAFMTDAAQNRYHPVKAYLENLVWDGQDHIAALSTHLTDAHEPIAYADSSQRTVIHAWFHRWLVGTVAKVYEPSEAQNPMLILDGGQGAGKSYLVKWLASPLSTLHFEGAIRPEDKDYLRYLTTKWVWEVSELGATMRKADREALKAFITLQDATYRPSYGRHALHKPALASFIGTVNFEGALLSDPTGHRRFLPVELTNIDWTYSQNVNPNQLWAQAFALYRNGESWKLTDEERKAHGVITEHYEPEDPYENWLRDIFDIDPANDAWFTPTDVIVKELVDAEHVAKGNQQRAYNALGATLTRLGLKRTRRRVDGGKPRGYVGIQAKTVTAGFE